MDIKIGGYPLDKEQLRIATTKEKEVLVVAGAGSGKTFTIVGRIWYLINIEKVNPEEILCISYTKDAASSLRNKLLKEFTILFWPYPQHVEVSGPGIKPHATAVTRATALTMLGP